MQLQIKLKEGTIDKPTFNKSLQELIFNRALKAVPLYHKMTFISQQLKAKQEKQKGQIDRKELSEFQSFRQIVETEMETVKMEAANLNPELAKSVWPAAFNAFKAWTEEQKKNPNAPKSEPAIFIKASEISEGDIRKQVKKQYEADQKDLKNRKKMEEEAQKIRADKIAAQLIADEEKKSNTSKEKKKTK